jgi:hypothetical protein
MSKQPLTKTFFIIWEHIKTTTDKNLFHSGLALEWALFIAKAETLLSNG